MNKEEFIEMLNDVIRGEEMLIPIYSRHVSTAVQWSGGKKSDTDRVREILARLMTDSQHHKEVFMKLKAKIEKGEIDVY